MNKDYGLLEAFGKGASEEMQQCKRVIESQLTEQPAPAASEPPSQPDSLIDRDLPR